MAEAELMTEEALKMEPEEDQTEGKTMKWFQITIIYWYLLI